MLSTLVLIPESAINPDFSWTVSAPVHLLTSLTGIHVREIEWKRWQSPSYYKYKSFPLSFLTDFFLVLIVPHSQSW
jgi:hypothetical protein